jgi:hypothetical protein
MTFSHLQHMGLDHEINNIFYNHAEKFVIIFSPTYISNFL